MKEKVTTIELLIPMALMAFTMMLLFAFQISRILDERDALNQTYGQLEAPFMESQNLNKQFGGLVTGSQKLAQEGNKTAQGIVTQLKRIGIIMEPTQPEGKEPVPGAHKLLPEGPKKP
ncbi:MAG: hypothetical protein AB7S81_06130 [Bdellovibrionales bacterium]